MSKAVTMKTIAAHAGVTQATVSMSLANNPRIPVTTRERIQAIAEKLGYRPNPYLSTLMRIRRKGRPLTDRPVLALVNCMAQPDAWRTTTALTIRQMREGGLERAVERGYRAQEFWLLQDGMSNDRFSEMLYARGIQGLILSPLADGAPPPMLKWQYFASVSLSVPLPASTINTVCNDHYFSALQVVRECYRLGYRRPGLIIRRIHRDRFHGRWDAGFQVARHLLPRISLAQPLLVDDWTDFSALPAWLKKQRPDVIVSPGAEPLHAALQRMGWRIPEDIGLAGLACSELGHPVSGVYQNGRLIGATAVDTLISMLERNERGLPEQAVTQMLEGVWNAGRTLRPI
ncbi:MAG TPA: LacI family DNA-binding transcriptional regulator [Opitutaceae bacterium]|nr:LacI family DNA-binding transcriptional regulator [Opitutaceae bacterium]